MAALVNFARPASAAPSFKATILPPPNASITERGVPQGLGSPARKLSISPDGTRLAFTAAGQDGIIWLWVRRLDSLTAQRLEGTQGAVYPFWSPDSKFIGFFAEGPPRRSKAHEDRHVRRATYDAVRAVRSQQHRGNLEPRRRNPLRDVGKSGR